MKTPEPGIYLLSVSTVSLEPSRINERLFAKVRFNVLAPPGAGTDVLFDFFSLQPPPSAVVTLGMVLFERFLRAALNNPMTSLTEILYRLTNGGNIIQPEIAQRLLHDRLRGCEVLARVALRESTYPDDTIVIKPVIKQYWPKEDAKRKDVK